MTDVTDELFDAENLAAIDHNIQEYVKDKTCARDLDCHVHEYGYK